MHTCIHNTNMPAYIHACQPLPTHTRTLAVPAEFGAQKGPRTLQAHTHEHRQRGDSGPRRAHEHPSHINKRLRASQRLFGTQMGPRTPLAQHMQSGTRKCIRMHANQKALGTQCGFTSASDRTCDPERTGELRPRLHGGSATLHTH